MNLAELRTALAEVAGPAASVDAAIEGAVRGRARRQRRVRVLGGAVCVLVVALIAAVIVVPDRGSDPLVATSPTDPDRVASTLGRFTAEVPDPWDVTTVQKPIGPLPQLIQATVDISVPTDPSDGCIVDGSPGASVVVVQELPHPAGVPGFPMARPDRITPRTQGGLHSDNPFCAVQQQMVSFDVGSRAIYIGISISPAASPARRKEVYRIANSLAFGPPAWTTMCTVAHDAPRAAGRLARAAPTSRVERLVRAAAPVIEAGPDADAADFTKSATRAYATLGRLFERYCGISPTNPGD